jgi:hypothetical protein
VKRISRELVECTASEAHPLGHRRPARQTPACAWGGVIIDAVARGLTPSSRVGSCWREPPCVGPRGRVQCGVDNSLRDVRARFCAKAAYAAFRTSRPQPEVAAGGLKWASPPSERSQRPSPRLVKRRSAVVVRGSSQVDPAARPDPLPDPQRSPNGPDSADVLPAGPLALMDLQVGHSGL